MPSHPTIIGAALVMAVWFASLEMAPQSAALGAESPPGNNPSAASKSPDPGRLCLTGNAPESQKHLNAGLAGRYTYYDGGTVCHIFPRPIPGRKLDEPNRNGGWVLFSEGILTDGKEETRFGWPNYQNGERGVDVFFDLGRECLIEDIAIVSAPRVRNLSLWLKSPGDEREVMVSDLQDRATTGKQGYPDLPNPHILRVNASAQQIRINGRFKGDYSGFAEVRIWGRPLREGEARPARAPHRQAGGKFVVENPQEIALEELADRAVFPIPQEMEIQKGAFAFSPKTRIMIPPDGSGRLEKTARVFSEDLKEIIGLQIEVSRGDVTAKDCIVIGLPSAFPSLKPVTADLNVDALPAEGYALRIEPDRIVIAGRDECGAFHGTQTLLQLVGRTAKGDWDAPLVRVRDYPRKSIRMVEAREAPSRELIRAFARYKVNDYQFISSWTAVAVQNASFAEDRFVKLTPLVDFQEAWGGNPESLVERSPGEKLSDLGVGRRNPCPSQPQTWKDYFARLDSVSACNSEYVAINMNEFYQPQNGSRWNVCALCRARKMRGHELMADTIRKIYDYAKSKGKKLIVNDCCWVGQGISHPDDAENDWRKITDLLPKDMLIFIWHPEIVERMHKAGYGLLLYAQGAQKAQEAVKPLWSGVMLDLADGPFYVEAILGVSQSLWSPDRTLSDTPQGTACIEAHLPIFRQLMGSEPLPSRQKGASFFTVDLAPVANTSFRDDAPFDGKGWVDLGGNYDLRALQPGKRTLTGVPFQITGGENNCVTVQNRLLMNKRHPSRVEIPLNKKAASLVFLHTLDDRPGQQYHIRKELCGYYFMVFEDGKYDKLEIKYNVNIANFDGLFSSWAYSPRSESLKRGRLAWKGQMGAGTEAALYYTEWVNPRPQKQIARVIFSSAHIPVQSSPILVAMTGVEPTPKDAAPSEPNADLRDVSFITPPRIVGTPIDLSEGVNESDHRWRTKDGILVECDDGLSNKKPGVGGAEPFWSRASSAVFDNLEWCRSTDPPGVEVRVTLPQPRKLAGVAITGSYRDEVSVNDFPPSILDYTIEVSEDGTNWSPVTTEKVMGYIPEEEGAKFHSLDNKLIKAVRVHVWRNFKTTSSYERGLAFLQLFETK